MMSSPRRILLLSLSGIGNFLMQSPVFAALKNKFPDAHLTVWVAPRGTKALAEIDPYIDEIIEASIKQSVRGHFKLVWHLSQQKFDAGIVLSPGQLWKSAAYLYLAGIKKRIGNTYPWRGNYASSFLLTDALPEDGKLHDIEQNLRLLEPLGIEPKVGVTGYKLQLPLKSQENAKEYLAQLNLSLGKNLIGFHMGSAEDLVAKRWPLENFMHLGKKLASEINAHILLFGGPNEKDLQTTVQQNLGDRASVITADLLTCAALMEHCSLFISNDSGLMHLAAASGTRTIGLFGPTDEKQTGPHGSRSSVLRAPGTQPVYHTEKNASLGSNPHATMRALTPEFVFEKLRLYL